MKENQVWQKLPMELELREKLGNTSNIPGMELYSCVSGLIRPPDVYKLGLESKSFYVLANQIEPHPRSFKVLQTWGNLSSENPPKVKRG